MTMSKFNMIDNLKDILNEQLAIGLFKGIQDGMVHYGDSKYKLSHPISDLNVLEFNLSSGYWKVKGNFMVGTKEGHINPKVLKHIVNELNKQSETIKFPLGGGYGDVTMTKI
jgi:hypothetical protein